MSRSPQNGGFHRCTGGGPLPPACLAAPASESSPRCGAAPPRVPSVALSCVMRRQSCAGAARRQISTRKPTSDKPSCGILKKSGARLAMRVRNANTANDAGPIAEPLARAHDGLVRDVIADVIDIDVEAQHFAVVQRARNVRRLHETEPDLDAVEPVPEPLQRVALAERHARPLFVHERQQHHLLMHDVVVLDVMQQHRRCAVVDLGQPDAHAGAARHHHLVDVLDEFGERHRHLVQPAVHLRGAAAPAQDQGRDHRGDQQRKPAAFVDLERVRCHESGVDRARMPRSPGRRPPTRHFQRWMATR